MQPTSVVVRVRRLECNVLQEEDIPLRSRLYSLAPREIGTIWCESLTGYINRLGWTHHVSPRALVAEMIVPLLGESLQLTFTEVGRFSVLSAMSLNEGGDMAERWIDALKQRTAQTDLHLLTRSWWIGNLPRRGQLRETPAWCPFCLTEWRKTGASIYQPLLWMFRVVTICPHHRDFLVDRCPSCQRRQTTITTNKTGPGECTYCTAWLGAESCVLRHGMPDGEHLAWQAWVISVLEELQTVSLEQSPIQWELFFNSLANFLKEQQAYSKLARFTGITRQALHRWVNNDDTYRPTLPTLLKFCYVCKITPVQVMRNQLEQLRHASSQRAEGASSLLQRQTHRVDRERCQALFQAVLEGREELLGMRAIAQRLGHAEASLFYHFPQKCAEITQRAKAYRKQRKEQRLALMSEQVQQATLAVHALGAYPSQDAVQSLLPSGTMRTQEAREIWRTTLRELGFEL
ncbi:MAG TPA: TniQ family protein [Ktedonobacteraceae bacterium]|nr:TniQ family protein [Ktedonobacteraceae bacterium]